MNKVMKQILITCFVVALIIGCGYLGVNVYMDSLLNQMNREEEYQPGNVEIAVEVAQTVKSYNIVNIALFGADNDGHGKTDEYDRADATKIISLNMDLKTITITSVQRDILVWLPDPENDWSKLNHAHWYGGPELAVKTLNYNLDLDITQYVGFSFDSLSKVVDLLGGVDIKLSNAEARQVGLSGAGTYHLDGKKALAYCRIRSIDSDYSRMARQNNTIQAIINTAKEKSVTELLSVISKLLPDIETNISNNDIKSYLTSILGFDFTNIAQYQVPSGGYNDTNSKSYHGYSPCYLLRSYQEMVKEVHKNIYGDAYYQPSTVILENEKKTYEKFGAFVE